MKGNSIMSEHAAKIRAKGCDATGVTEQIASSMYSTLGGYTMAVVEMRHEAIKDTADGGHSVELVITQLEPATTERMETHLRELTRALYKSRAINDHQPILPGTLGDGAATLDDVIGQGEALIDRTEDGEVGGVWDGDIEAPAPDDGLVELDSVTVDGGVPDEVASPFQPKIVEG